MRKTYYGYSGYGHRSPLPFILIALGLLFLLGKGLLFPLLFFGAMWWLFSRGVCGMGWHHDDGHSDRYEKRKRKNDEAYWDEDGETVII